MATLAPPSSPLVSASWATKEYNILVIDGNKNNNWVDLFRNKRLSDGSTIRVVQASWAETTIAQYVSKCLVTCAPLHDTHNEAVRPMTLSFTPHFCIIRNQVRGPAPNQDKRNVLFGLMLANLPSINSLQSIYACLERPIIYGALKQLSDKLGDKFPLIPFSYFSTPECMIYEAFPAVVKVGHCQGKVGKVIAETEENFQDIAAILSLNADYATIEPYISTEYSIRVQKIGSHYRVLKKMYDGMSWKATFGGPEVQEVELNDTYKTWVNEASKLFGGLDILSIDAIKGTDGSYYILELNSTASNFSAAKWKDDSSHIVDLAIEKLNSLFTKPVTIASPERPHHDFLKSEHLTPPTRSRSSSEAPLVRRSGLLSTASPQNVRERRKDKSSSKDKEKEKEKKKSKKGKKKTRSSSESSESLPTPLSPTISEKALEASKPSISESADSPSESGLPATTQQSETVADKPADKTEEASHSNEAPDQTRSHSTEEVGPSHDASNKQESTEENAKETLKEEKTPKKESEEETKETEPKEAAKESKEESSQHEASAVRKSSSVPSVPEVNVVSESPSVPESESTPTPPVDNNLELEK